MDLRAATEADVPLLARWNRELIEDEGADNLTSPAELEARMRAWLAGDYRAVIFEAWRALGLREHATRFRGP